MRPADRREGLTVVDESIDLILRQPGHGLAVHVALKLHEIAARRVVQREFAAGQPLDGIGLGLGDVAIGVDKALRLGRGERDGLVGHRYLLRVLGCGVLTDEGHPHAGKHRGSRPGRAAGRQGIPRLGR